MTDRGAEGNQSSFWSDQPLAVIGKYAVENRDRDKTRTETGAATVMQKRRVTMTEKMIRNWPAKG